MSSLDDTPSLRFIDNMWAPPKKAQPTGRPEAAGPAIDEDLERVLP